MANDCILTLLCLDHLDQVTYSLVNLASAVHLDRDDIVERQVATRMVQIGLAVLKSPLLSFHIPTI